MVSLLISLVRGLADMVTKVTDIFKLEDYQGALDKMSSRGALKIAIKP